ncbi:MAG TPA: hypothetical protein VJO32_09765, partial [Ktedonobacteraceae bacterium]|nr:hypothetical protein [Ktedonobacteraceae bacterium]
DVGSFVPLHVSTSGKVVREVAPASIALPLPVHPGQSLLLRVALIRDLRYNRDLVILCERVNTAAPQLPDGRRLLFQVRDLPCPVLDMQKRQVA